MLLTSEAKTITLFFSTTPYGSERAHTVLKLAEAALARGHRVNLFASSDAVYGAVSKQKVRGLPDIGAQLEGLMRRGARVDLCGSCLQYRGLGRDRLIPGAEPSSLKNLFGMVQDSDVFLTFTG